MKKDPTYIGVFAIDGKATARDVKKYCRECLLLINEEGEDQVAGKYLTEYEQWVPPQDNHHITTVFIGGKKGDLKHKEQAILNNFEANKKTYIIIDFMVYVPDYLMVGYCSKIDVECANTHPHVTLMLKNKAKAFESNAVLEQLLTKHPQLLYYRNFHYKTYEVPYAQQQIMYVINRPLSIPAITGNNFTHGRR